MSQDSRIKKQLVKIPILILHGWKLSGKKYTAIEKIFKREGFTVLAPDMPGFDSQKLNKDMFLDDYVEFILMYLNQKKIKKTYILGHSFGARVGTKFTYSYPEYVQKLILTGAPLLRHKSLRIKLLGIVGSSSKAIFSFLPTSFGNFFRKILYHIIGEFDYYKAGELKETFKNIINEDLSDVLPQIRVPTLVVWGESEKVVSVNDGKEIARKVPNGSYIGIVGGSHRVPYENPEEFARIVLDFLT